LVAENYAELKLHGVFAAGIPEGLGDGGATYPEICEMLRILARHFSSTALALAMHTHLRGDGLALAAGPARRILPASHRK